VTGNLYGGRTTLRRSALSALVTLLGAASPLAAQLPLAGVGAGVRFESYSFSDAAKVNIDHVQLLTIPVSARVLIGQRVELGLSGAYARGTLQRQAGQESQLSGLTDTEVRLTAILAGDRLRLGAVALLPTGTSELDPSELDVAGLVAADVLPFTISNWGTGGGIGANASAALPVAEGTSIGLSAGYVLAREYQPISASSPFNYRPGNQLHLRAALDQMIGTASRATLQLTYQQYGADERDNTNIYQAGDRLQAVATLAFPAGPRGSAIVYGGWLRRLEGTYTNPLLPITPVEDVLYAGGGLRQPLGRLVLTPSADLRVVGNDGGFDQGYTITAGTGLEVPLGGVDAIPFARVRFGHITVRENQESSLTGLELGLTLRNRTQGR